MANQIIDIDIIQEEINVNIQVGATYTYAPSGDMLKSVYDIDNDGKVDFAKDLLLDNDDWNQFNLILFT